MLHRSYSDFSVRRQMVSYDTVHPAPSPLPGGIQRVPLSIVATKVPPVPRRSLSSLQEERLPRPDPAFLAACQKGEVEDVKKVLLRNPTAQSVNHRDSSGRTGLIHICMNGQLDVLQLMADYPGLDVNLADSEGNTALMMAAQAGHLDIVAFLLDRFQETVEVDHRNIFGLTALMKAALQGRTRCVKLLLNAGANPFLRDPSRRFCAIDWAKLCGRYTCAESLEKAMATSLYRPLSEETPSSRTAVSSLQSADLYSRDPPPEAASEHYQLDSHGHPVRKGPITGENSWFRQKLRKTFKYTDLKKRRTVAEFGAFNNITASSMICASSAILSNMEGAPSAATSGKERHYPDKKTVIIPRVEISHSSQADSYQEDMTSTDTKPAPPKPPPRRRSTNP